MYHRYEQGQVPKEKNLRVIAAACGVTVDWLLGRSDEPAPGAAGAEGWPAAVREQAPGYRRAPADAGMPQGCRYPADCDLPAQLHEVRDELATVQAKLDTLCVLLGARLDATLQPGKKAG